MPAKIVPVIMCGGAGTRLWPLSRESMPKQFVPLVGETSTFQQVMSRVADGELFGRPIVITNAEFRFVIAEQLRDCGIGADIVLEPVRRDSGPAVAVSALLAIEREPEALVLVLASDHVVRKLKEFRAACDDVGGDRAVRTADGAGGESFGYRCDPGSRFSAAGAGRVCSRAQEVYRLCRDGKDQACRGRPRRSGLVRYWQLEHRLGNP